MHSTKFLLHKIMSKIPFEENLTIFLSLLKLHEALHAKTFHLFFISLQKHYVIFFFMIKSQTKNKNRIF